MNRRHATRSSWKNEPMLENKIRIFMQRTFTPEEYMEIQKGYIPEVVEDKWFMYYEDGWLNVHRSWTGLCVCQLHFVKQNDVYHIDEAYISDTFHSMFHEMAEDHLLYFIDRFLLGKNVKAPRRPISTNKES